MFTGLLNFGHNLWSGVTLENTQPVDRPHVTRENYCLEFVSLKEAAMAQKASKRREWTKQDAQQLKSMAKAKTPAPKIAKALKRTVGATRQKAFSMGVSLDSR